MTTASAGAARTVPAPADVKRAADRRWWRGSWRRWSRPRARAPRSASTRSARSPTRSTSPRCRATPTGCWWSSSAGRSSSSTTASPAPSSTSRDRASPTGLERGLLSVALAPDYATSGHLYVYLHAGARAATVEVDEYTAAGDSVAAVERPAGALDRRTPLGDENGGQLQFGPDGYALRRDRRQRRRPSNGAEPRLAARQDPADRPAAVAARRPYSIPRGQPVRRAPGRQIWATGCATRGASRSTGSPGDCSIGDVGQFAREEVDYSPAAAGRRARHELRLGLPRGDDRLPRRPRPCGPRFTSSRSSTTRTEPMTVAARSPAATSSATRASATSTAATCYADACDGEIRSLVPSSPAPPTPLGGPAGRHCRPASARTPAAASTSRRCGPARSRGSSATRRRAAPGRGAAAPPPRCAGEPATRVAGDGRAIGGSPGDDVIVADGRKNRIKSGGGDDVICAKGGADKIRGGRGRDKLRGGAGRDRCKGGPGKDRLRSC